VKDLGTERYSLKKIIKGMKTQRDWEARNPSRGSAAVVGAFTQVQARATSLYSAISKCWTCDSHTMHKVMIRLENRIVDPRETTQWTTKQKQDVVFKLFFSIDEVTFQEVQVTAHVVEPSKGNPENKPLFVAPVLLLSERRKVY